MKTALMNPDRSPPTCRSQSTTLLHLHHHLLLPLYSPLLRPLLTLIRELSMTYVRVSVRGEFDAPPGTSLNLLRLVDTLICKEKLTLRSLHVKESDGRPSKSRQQNQQKSAKKTRQSRELTQGN